MPANDVHQLRRRHRAPALDLSEAAGRDWRVPRRAADRAPRPSPRRCGRRTSRTSPRAIGSALRHRKSRWRFRELLPSHATPLAAAAAPSATRVAVAAAGSTHPESKAPVRNWPEASCRWNWYSSRCCGSVGQEPERLARETGNGLFESRAIVQCGLGNGELLGPGRGGREKQKEDSRGRECPHPGAPRLFGSTARRPDHSRRRVPAVETGILLAGIREIRGHCRE